LSGAVTDGIGLTVIDAFWLVPTQPLADGVTVIRPVEGVVVLLVPANDPIEDPDPEPTSPMLVLLFTQVNVVLPTNEENESAVVLTLAHTVWVVTGEIDTFGVGYTVTDDVTGDPIHP
jgi:hypothetical protein